MAHAILARDEGACPDRPVHNVMTLIAADGRPPLAVIQFLVRCDSKANAPAANQIRFDRI
jgi:hypothetical protein